MRASLLGSDGNQLCQLAALRQGFAALGHEHTPQFAHPDTAFVFVGNPPFAPYLDLARSRTKKTIFNVLDLPTFHHEWPEIQHALKEALPLADRVTTISKTTQRDLLETCGIQSEVIYYPMKPVYYTGGCKYPQFKVALVGRVADENKRTQAAIKALIRAGYEETEVAVIGPEHAGWGTHFGVVSDEVLNDVYNSVDYVLMLSAREGIGLPAIEAACCGAIPIVAATLNTLGEFWVDSPLGIHYQQLNSVEAVAKLMTDLNRDLEWKAATKRAVREHADTHFRPLFDRVEVARRIVSIYQSI